MSSSTTWLIGCTRPRAIALSRKGSVRSRRSAASLASSAAPARDCLRAWIASCQVVLLFLDSTHPDREQLDAFDLLLTELRKPSAGPGRLERPIGLVLTKWDQQGPVSDDLAQGGRVGRPPGGSGAGPCHGGTGGVVSSPVGGSAGRFRGGARSESPLVTVSGSLPRFQSLSTSMLNSSLGLGLESAIRRARMNGHLVRSHKAHFHPR